MSPPAVLQFQINDGDGSTTNPVVRLHSICDEQRTYVAEMRASSREDRVETTWVAYAPEMFFTLSPGSGRKHVWFRVRNRFGESAMVSAAIDLLPPVSSGCSGPVVYQDGGDNLWVCDEQGANHFPVLQTGDCSQPAWSLDGGFILFIRGGKQVWCVSPDGKNPRMVGVWSGAVSAPMLIGPTEFVVTHDTWTADMFILLRGDLSGSPLHEAWRPARVGAPKWGFSYDFSIANGKLVLSACESNWTPSGDLYVVNPANWELLPLWSDRDNNHEDGLPRWSARGDRVAWSHGVQAGVSPRNWVIGVLAWGTPGSQPRWIGAPTRRTFLQDWTHTDELLVLDVTGDSNSLNVMDQGGVLRRHIACPRSVRNARWNKTAQVSHRP
jgi:hypothetical protein